MKKIFSLFLIALSCCFMFSNIKVNTVSYADTTKTYYTVYKDSTKKDVLFLRGGDVTVGDKYLSTDNKLYEIVSVNDKDKTAYVKFLKDEKLPKVNVAKNTNASNNKSASAATTKKVGIYHTHNDESYFTPDGVDSVYGKGGIYDVGKALVKNFNKLGVETIYREDLHLPHNSGAYTRSQVTANALLNEGVDAIFDLHRDSTKRSEYLTKVDGKEMSHVRMVVGASSANYEENKKFAYTIKAYADEVYPGLVKDIYIGKGNYNQQLSTRAMLFEMGCENIEKDYVIKTTDYLAKTLTGVLYGTEATVSPVGNEVSQVVVDNGNSDQAASLVSDSSNVNSNMTLYAVLGVVGAVIGIFGIVMLVSKKARYKVSRFFSEMFAGMFGKKATHKQ